MRYLALGDSYTIGEAVAPFERWPIQLVRLLQADGLEEIETKIIAQTGWTTFELEAGIEAASPEGAFDLVTLLIGVNNQYRGLEQSAYRAEFADLLRQAVAFAGEETGRVIVLSIPDWSVTPFADGRDRGAIGAEIEVFNTINRNESQKCGVYYVDVTEISRQADQDPALLADDGLHPSGKMYAQWAELVRPIAAKVLGRPGTAG